MDVQVGLFFISNRLMDALEEYTARQCLKGSLIKSLSGRAINAQVVTNWFSNLYSELGFEGCSSHSGRRTAITKWARNISAVGGSMRDVQILARHSSLAMTQRYIEVSENAMRKVVG